MFIDDLFVGSNYDIRCRLSNKKEYINCNKNSILIELIKTNNIKHFSIFIDYISLHNLEYNLIFDNIKNSNGFAIVLFNKSIYVLMELLPKYLKDNNINNLEVILPLININSANFVDITNAILHNNTIYYKLLSIVIDNFKTEKPLILGYSSAFTYSFYNNNIDKDIIRCIMFKLMNKNIYFDESVVEQLVYLDDKVLNRIIGDNKLSHSTIKKYYEKVYKEDFSIFY